MRESRVGIMRTFKAIDQEIAEWRQHILAQNAALALLEACAEEIASNRTVLFQNINKHTEFVRNIRRLRSKISSAENELTRCQSEWCAVAAHVAKLRANLDGYKARLKPRAIDWSRMDTTIDRAAYLEEIRGKIVKLEQELRDYE
jgi:chromosome segregation ATPase